jgi:hypothetical protein
MSEPVCRTCYAATLPDYERERFHAEQVTMPIHYCPEHRRVWDRMWSDHPSTPIKFVLHGTITGRFRRVEEK